MTGKPTYEELRAVFDSLPTADAKLAWMETLPEDSSFFMKEPRNPEFSSMEQEMSSPRSTRLSPAELESLRAEFKRSSAWAAAALAKSKAPDSSG